MAPWGGPAQPFPPSSEIRPSTAWYWIAAGVGLVCLLVGIVLIVRTAITFVDKIDDFQRVDVPGTATVQLDEGSYTVYAEDGFFGEFAVSCADIEIRDPRERTVELRPYSSRVTYDSSGHEGVARCSFRADAAGIYRVSASRASGTIAIGPGLGAGLVGGAVGGILLMVAGGLFALVTIIVTAVRRGNARRRQLAAVYGPYPG